MAKHHRTSAITTFLIVAVLLVGAAACDGAGDHTYQLTISSTSGGLVANPGEGTFAYPAGTVVQLTATPDDGYQFLSWTGDSVYIADPDATSTIITMNADYAVVANFQTEDETGPANGGGGTPTQP